MSKRRFLMVTDISTNTRVAIPIKQIIQIKEYKHNEDYLAWIQYYYTDKKTYTIYTKELFYNIMTGCHTFEL